MLKCYNNPAMFPKMSQKCRYKYTLLQNKKKNRA